MKKRSLKREIIVPSVVILVFLVIVMTVYSTYVFFKFTSNLAHENISVAAKNVKNYLKEYEAQSRVAAISVPLYPEVIRAVRERDTAGIIKAINPMLVPYGVTYITITDETGTALARTFEPERFGDSAFHLQNIQDAILEGKISTYYEQGPLIRVSVHTGAPIYDYDGTLIGAMSAGVRLDDNESMDRLNELFNADFSVVLRNERIATTVMQDGERAIGASPNAEIAKTVIATKQEYFGYSYLNGIRYYTAFLPLINSKDEVFAILIAGLSNTQLLKQRNDIIFSSSVIGLIGLILSIAMLLYNISKSLKPVNKLMRLVSDVTQGNVNVEIDRTIVTNGDEIGLLISDVYSLIDVIKSMLVDLSHLTHKLTVSGDVEFQLDTSKYSGSYKKIIDGIKALGDSILMKNKTMAAMDFLDTMVIVTDFDYNVLYVNQCLMDTYGIDRKNSFEQKCYKFVRNLDEPCSICRLKEFENTSIYSSAEYKYLFDECLDTWIGGKAAIIPWIDGSMVFCNYFSDETRVKNYEKQLYEAAYKAEEASIAKSAFLAHMSHEIRTPLNSIMGFSELALDDGVSPKTRDYLGKILENSEWLLQIINDILDISKIESGKMELEHIPFDMHELLASCRTLITPKAYEKGIVLHFYAEPSLGKMPLGDPTRLRQVFVNLLSNAIKFTNSGMVKLYSDIIDKSDKTVTMHFEIKDSGIGMTEEQIEKIFEPFVQAESGTTRKYGGTGLGLPITKSILELMGGKLSVESTPGVGSKFDFNLTFDTIDITGRMLDKKMVFSEIEKPMFEGEILLCEDNAMNQEVICEHLARIGFKTVVAENGKIGVEKVQHRKEKGEKQFDLIFMDMHMPVMDGLEAAAKIIELDTGVPIVAMTANIMSDDMDVYSKSGMTDCVGKPFTSQELWRCLMKYFRPINWQAVSETQQTKAENELRQKLISNFLKDNRNSFSRIVEAVDTGDIQLAHRLAHTLKGNAGQLGKTRLQKAAEDVEHHLKDGKNSVASRQMSVLKAELDEVLAEFAGLPGEFPKPEAQLEPLDAESARELINQLEPLLKMGNPECRNLIDSLRRVPGSEELIQQMEDLDFEPAIVTLAGLKKKL